MPLRLPRAPAVEEEVELFVCTDPACPSHAGGQPAAVILWGANETERTVACSFCYYETSVPPTFRYETVEKNGQQVQVAVEILTETQIIPHGARVRCVKGEGAAVVLRNAETHEVIRVLSEK